jgi:O-acetyl-ADP-ribose deacetylase (regulator of RNase III)
VDAVRRTLGAITIECVRGDITNQPDVDAVVNAANAGLAPGGGVAGAIHSVAGLGLYEECKPLAPIGAGDAVITSGHGLPNRWCIHVLGPVYAQSASPATELASCYREALARAEENDVRSIATPAISTGIFGYPVGQAADVAMRTIAERASDLRSVRLVRFVLWAPADLDAHVRALEAVAS